MCPRFTKVLTCTPAVLLPLQVKKQNLTATLQRSTSVSKVKPMRQIQNQAKSLTKTSCKVTYFQGSLLVKLWGIWSFHSSKSNDM